METKEKLIELHYIDKLSSIKIAEKYNVSSRTIRYWFAKHNIEMIGNTFTKGRPNEKNKYPRTEKQLETLRRINIGKVPYNKGYGQVEFTCKVCGKIDKDKPYRRKNFCSKECKDLYSHIMKGTNHWNYKGENNYLQRNWAEYKEWRINVLKRDNYSCKKCGITKKNLNAHHIKQFALYPELRFDIENGVTLCKDCHEKLHAYAGRTKINEVKQTEWLGG